MRCPVLTTRTVTRTVLPGADAKPRRQAERLRFPPLPAYARATQCAVLTNRPVVSAYARATWSPVAPAIRLRACYAVSGTHVAHGAVAYARGIDLASVAMSADVMRSTDLAYGGTRRGHSESALVFNGGKR
eukprot:2616692-Rhodomonas_salina.1